MYVRGDKINEALIFIILIDISSYPCESLGFMDLIILFISYVVIFFDMKIELG
jgi:hypothetical protein